MAIYRMTAARRAALRKAQLASARKRKRSFHAKNRQKLQSKRYKRKGLVEYKRTGLATTTPSRTFGGAMRKAKRGGKHNIRYGKKLAKHNKRINKAIARTQRQPLKHRALSKLQGSNPHSRRATFVAETSARYSKAGRKRRKR